MGQTREAEKYLANILMSILIDGGNVCLALSFYQFFSDDNNDVLDHFAASLSQCHFTSIAS